MLLYRQKQVVFHASSYNSLILLLLLLLQEVSSCSSQEENQNGNQDDKVKVKMRRMMISHERILDMSLHGFLMWGSMGFLMPLGILAIRCSSCIHQTSNLPKPKLICFYSHLLLQVIKTMRNDGGGSHDDCRVDLCLFQDKLDYFLLLLAKNKEKHDGGDVHHLHDDDHRQIGSQILQIKDLVIVNPSSSSSDKINTLAFYFAKTNALKNLFQQQQHT